MEAFLPLRLTLTLLARHSPGPGPPSLLQPCPWGVCPKPHSSLCLPSPVTSPGFLRAAVHKGGLGDHRIRGKSCKVVSVEPLATLATVSPRKAQPGSPGLSVLP